jgi:hypothetical protein
LIALIALVASAKIVVASMRNRSFHFHSELGFNLSQILF